jgi:hypothetical protein
MYVFMLHNMEHKALYFVPAVYFAHSTDSNGVTNKTTDVFSPMLSLHN